MYLRYSPDFRADYFPLRLDITLYCWRFWLQRQAHFHLQKIPIVNIERFSSQHKVCWQHLSLFWKQQVIGAAKSNCYKNFILFSGKFTFELSVRWQKTSSSRVASQQPKSSLKMFRYRPFLLREITDQQKLRIWALFTQWKLSK